MTPTNDEIVIVQAGTAMSAAGLYRLGDGTVKVVARVEAAWASPAELLERLGRAAGRELGPGVPVVTLSQEPWPVLVAGVARGITAESVYKAVQDAGLAGSDILSVDDRRMDHEKVAAIRRAPKGAVVLGGGVDAGLLEFGQGQQVTDMAGLLARGLSPGAVPVVYAGSREALPGVQDVLEGHTLILAENPRPVLEEENLEGLIKVLMDVYRQAAGPAVWPWGLAFRRGLARVQAALGDNVIAVGLHGTAAEVASVVDGQAHRTGYQEDWPEPRRMASRTLPWDAVAPWLPWQASDQDENVLENFRLRPATVAMEPRELFVRYAYHRALLGRALAEHQEMVATLRGLKKARTIADVFADRQTTGGVTLVDMKRIKTIIAAGPSWREYDLPALALALVDGLQPVGLTGLLWDKDDLIVAAGVADIGWLQKVASSAGGDGAAGLVALGAVAAVTGRSGAGLGHVLGRVEWSTGSEHFQEPIQAGVVRRFSLPAGQWHVNVVPARGVDAGAGPGQPVSDMVPGGPVGLIVDGRSRPVRAHTGRDPETWRQVARWYEGVGALPAGLAVAGRQAQGKVGVK